MDLMSNKRKKKPTSRGRGKAKAKAKAKAKRTSRGIVTQYLPFRAHTYGKNLPEWAKKLGYAGDTIPVVTYPTMAKAGVYGLPSVGRILNKPRGKAKAKVSKIEHLESQMSKAVVALTQAITAGATAEKIEGLRAKLVKLQELIVAERVFEAKVQAAIAGATPAQIRKKMRAAMKGAAKDVGMTEKQAAAAPVVQVAAAAPVTPAARAAAVDVAFRDTPEGQEMIRGSLFGTPALSPLEARRRAERMMQRNPDVYGYAKGGKKKVLLDMVPATRGTPGAVTVVVSPHAFRYATLVEKALKKNGLYSVRKNMSKKRRMHKNPLGSDLMALGRPVLGATAGFAASRAVNALALYGLSKTKMDLSGVGAQIGIRAAATAVGVVGTLALGDKVGLIRDNRTSIVTGMVLNVLESAVRNVATLRLTADTNPYLRNLALGASYYDVSHAGAPYSPMMGEYVSQSLNGDMGSYIAQAAAGMGEYVSQSLNGGDGLGEYVSQSLNGFGEYAEGVDPSDQEGVDGMINNAEAVAGLSGTEVMAATAGLGMTEVMAATAGLGATQGMNRGIVTRRGVYNFFTQPVAAGRGNIPTVSIEDAPMPVVGMGPAHPGAVPIGDQVSTPEGRGYAGGIFGRHIFGTMV
jgi:hypothetical protein